jgi:hypothetical protein
LGDRHFSTAIRLLVVKALVAGKKVTNPINLCESSATTEPGQHPAITAPANGIEAEANYKKR